MDGPLSPYTHAYIYIYIYVCVCVFKILTGKDTGKRPLGRSRHRWDDSIRMDIKEIGVNTRH